MSISPIFVIVVLEARFYHGGLYAAIYAN